MLSFVTDFSPWGRICTEYTHDRLRVRASDSGAGPPRRRTNRPADDGPRPRWRWGPTVRRSAGAPAIIPKERHK